MVCAHCSHGIAAHGAIFAGDEKGRLLGVTNGFVAPAFKLAHCDTLQIFTKG